MANTTGLKRGGSPGRPKGVPNKATKEVKELARRLVLEPEYQQKLRQRLLKGTLPPAVESMLWFYAFGKPKDTVEVSVARKVINILPPTSVEAEPETLTPELAEIENATKLELPEEPPVRHLPVADQPRTWGPPVWPRRKQ